LSAFKYIIENNLIEQDIDIYSDSIYCVNICNNWIWNWVNNDWKNSKNEIIKNFDLIESLYKYLNTKNLSCQVKKINGHSGIVGNELADALATNNWKKFEDIKNKNNLKGGIKNDKYSV
jgi:ribonuclease HI